MVLHVASSHSVILSGESVSHADCLYSCGSVEVSFLCWRTEDRVDHFALFISYTSQTLYAEIEEQIQVLYMYTKEAKIEVFLEY